MAETSKFSHLRLFAITATLCVLAMLYGPVVELFVAWYSGAMYEQWMVTGALAQLSFPMLLVVYLAMRVGYAVAGASLLVGAWCCVRRSAKPSVGIRYLVAGASLGTSLYVALWLAL